jgi:translation initiation factor IF-3
VLKERTNKQIRATELRVIDEDGSNIGVLSLEDALKLAMERGLDLIEVAPDAKPPVARIMEFGKYQYAEQKKQRKMRSGAKTTETKSVQIKIGTGDHDLLLKAKNASKWLADGHRIKVELYLSGRAKYLDPKFLKERMDRMLNLITEDFKVGEEFKKGMKGYTMVIERAKKA